MSDDKLFWIRTNVRDSEVEYSIETKYRTGSIIPVPRHIHDKISNLITSGYENSAINQLMIFNTGISNETATIIVDSMKYPDKY